MEKVKRFFRIRGKRIASAMLTLMLCLSMLSVGMITKAEEPLDTTFYTMSSAAAGWLSNYFAENNSGPPLNGGEAGGLLGYCDEADTSNVIVDFIQSAISTSSSSYSYESLRKMGGNYINYGNYGRVLKNLGLDDTANMGEKMLRKVTGSLMLVLFNLSTFINLIFTGMIEFMKKINPFRLFKVNGASLINVGAVSDGIETIQISGSNSLSDYLSNIFVFIRDNFAWAVVIPGALGILIVSIFLTRKDKGFELKKFIWRIAMIAFVIPIMGSLYTTSLNWLGSTISPSNGTPAVKIIGSLFVDFEGWVKSSNLSIVDTGITISDLNVSGASLQMDANIGSLRQTALAINNKASGDKLSVDASSEGDIKNWNKSLNSTSGSDATKDASDYVRDMLERYSSANFYGPGDYQSYKKAEWGTFKGTDYEKMVDGSNELLDWTDDDAYGKYLNGNSGGLGLWNSSADKPWLGMSDMSMYNYLSSSFNNTGIEVYSNEKAASGYVRKQHYSVNMIGTGLTSAIMYVNALVMLGCLIILAISYACGMMVASVKRTFRVITSVPLATLGSLRFGAKLIGNTVMMLGEIVATLFMYSIGVSLMYGVMNVIDGMFSGMITSVAAFIGSNGAINAAGLAAEYIMSTIMYIWLAIMLVRYRKKAIKAVDEAIADIINRLVPGAKSSDMIDPQKPSLASRALGAGGAAAGAAAAGYAMNKMAGAGDAAKGNASGETSASADGGDGGGGNGGDGGDGGDVNINNDSQVAVSDDDTVNADMDAGGEGFDNDDNSDEEGKAAIGASDLDEAGTGIEEDGDNTDIDNLDGDDNTDNTDIDTEDAGEGEEVGGENSAAEGDAASGSGGSGSPSGNASEGQKAVKSAQADLARSEKEKENLKKALASSGGQTGTGGNGGKGQAMSDGQSQKGYKAAMDGQLKGAAQSDDKPGPGAAAAQRKKGAPLTPAERAAAENAAKAIKDGSAREPVKGVSPLTPAQSKTVANAAVSAAQAANGGKPLTAAQKKEVAAAAQASAMQANTAANLANTNQEAAKMAAEAVNGGKPLSSNDKQMVSQAASQVQAAAQRATSPEGLAQAAALQAAQAANGGKALTPSQYQSVKQTAAQSASQVQSAAMAAAENAKGAPLTAAEVAAVRQQCGVQAAQQAAVNAVEQCMEQPLTESQRAGLMEAAKGHAGSILADNSQVRQAERSAAAAAKAMQTVHRTGKMSAQQYAQMMGNVRQATQQTVANAQPVNMASRAAVNAANQMRAGNGQAPMNAAQTQQVIQHVAGTPEVQAQQQAVMRQQAYSNDAQAAARQMMDMYGGSDGAQMSDGSYSAQAASIRSQAQSNYNEIESMKAQLAARGYSQEQIAAIARNENAARRGETQGVGAGDRPNIDLKQAAAFGAVRQVMNDHQQTKASVEQQKAAMDEAGKAKQPKPKRDLGSGFAGDILE